MRLRGTLIVMAIALLVAAAPERETGRNDLEKLQGDWTTKSFLLGGGPLPKEKQFPDRVMTIMGAEFSEVRNGKVAVRGDLKIDSSKEPKWLDATFTQGGPTGETIHGIYQLDGDTLKVCIGTPEDERPTKFESKTGTKLRLIVYERKRP